MDTDRDRDIALLEVQEENRKLVEEVMREKLGNRAQRMQNAQDRGTGSSAQGETAGGAPGPAAI